MVSLTARPKLHGTSDFISVWLGQRGLWADEMLKPNTDQDPPLLLRAAEGVQLDFTSDTIVADVFIKLWKTNVGPKVLLKSICIRISKVQ